MFFLQIYKKSCNNNYCYNFFRAQTEDITKYIASINPTKPSLHHDESMYLYDER